MRAPMENLVSIDNILKAKGESAKGKGNSEMKVISVKKADNGEVTIEVEVSFSTEVQPLQNNTPVQVPFQGGGINGGGIQIQIQPAIAPVPPNAAPVAQPMQMIYNSTGIELQDEKGKAYALSGLQYGKNMWQQTARTMSATMTFKPADKDQGDAAKLVFKGTRLATVDVPFVLKDVPVK